MSPATANKSSCPKPWGKSIPEQAIQIVQNWFAEFRDRKQD